LQFRCRRWLVSCSTSGRFWNSRRTSRRRRWRPLVRDRACLRALERHRWSSRRRRRLLCRFSGSLLSDTLSSGLGDLRGLSTFGLYQSLPFVVFSHAFSSICLRHGEARRYVSSLLGTLQYVGFSLHWNTSKVIESLWNETNPTPLRRLVREVWARTVAPSSDF
jgi:hypothetical protein